MATVTQNALLGVAAILLTLYFTLRVDCGSQEQRPSAAAVSQRFPKFVLGFLGGAGARDDLRR
ncbi:hypothetical protein [Micropruina sp.]|uniref:hypothetical protein n=1 Tax=Micropruina sp. TaxID=2737536 RepID=UPI0039E3F739